MTFSSGLALHAAAQKKIFPAIKNYGGIYESTFEYERPNPDQEFKIVAELGGDISKKEVLFESLEKIARMYNLHIYSGIYQKNLNVAVIISSGATLLILNNEEYKKRFGVDNPNLAILEEMQGAGISFFVCGQSVLKEKIGQESIFPNIRVTLSRYTFLTDYQNKGYNVFKF